MDEQSSAVIAGLRGQLLAKLGADADHYPVGIETRFPHILEKIVAFWDTEMLDEYLAGLVMPDRVGRQGFPPDVARELVRLAALHAAKGFSPGDTTDNRSSGSRSEP